MIRYRFIWIASLCLLVLIGLSACGTGGTQSETLTSAEMSNDNDRLAGLPQIETGGDTTLTQSGNGSEQNAARIILKSARLSLTVTDPTQAVQDITQLVEDIGGWVVTSNISTFNDTLSGSITVRIPSEQLNSVLEQVKSSAEKVDSEEISGQDVTQEYTDLQSQLTNLQLAEERIQGFLDIATNATEVLEIHNTLVDIRGQIEMIQGRIRYYNESAAYSSVAITLNAPTQAEKTDEDTWKPGDTVSEAVDGLVGLMQFIVDVVIWVAIIGIPLLLIVGIGAMPLWVGRRYLKSRQDSSE